MKVLILYATVEGQTGKVARFAADEAARLGHEVVLTDADDTAELDLDGVEAVILAAPVHQRRHPRTFEALVKGFGDALRERRTLLLSVSMSAAFSEGLEEARDYVIEMNMRTGFTPDDDLLVAGAVKTSIYDYFAMQVIRHVVLRGRDYDPSTGEHEFTDWDALKLKLNKFLGGGGKT